MKPMGLKKFCHTQVIGSRTCVHALGARHPTDQLRGRDFRSIAAKAPDESDSASVGETLQGLVDRGLPADVYDHVCAAPAGQLQHSIAPSGDILVVDAVVRAQRSRALKLLI